MYEIMGVMCTLVHQQMWKIKTRNYNLIKASVVYMILFITVILLEIDKFTLKIPFFIPLKKKKKCKRSITLIRLWFQVLGWLGLH